MRCVVVCALFVITVTTQAPAAASSDKLVQLDKLAMLKNVLTPVGAERAGNADGTIPAWSGGYVTPPSGYREGDPRPDPFAGDKPLFSITAKNLDTYADRLPEGAKALLRKYPDYRMDVYPTHRSAAAPASVYANIFLNATRAHAAPAGIAYGVEGA